MGCNGNGRTYEDLAGDAAEKAGLVPVNGGMDCPPLRAKLFRLAEATQEGNVLSAELSVLLRHTEQCPLCGHDYNGLLAFMSAPKSEGLGASFWDENTPLRALVDAVNILSFEKVEDRSAGNLFRMVYEAAKLTEAEAFDALGMDSTTSEQEVIDSLCCLGVPPEVLGLS